MTQWHVQDAWTHAFLHNPVNCPLLAILDVATQLLQCAGDTIQKLELRLAAYTVEVAVCVARLPCFVHTVVPICMC